MKSLLMVAFAAVALLSSKGCADDDPDTSRGDISDTSDTPDVSDGSDVSDTAADAGGDVAADAADGPEVSDAGDVADAGDTAVPGPAIESATVSVDADNPFRATLSVATDVPTTLRVSLTDPDGAVTRTIPTGDAAVTSHEVALIGLYAGPTFTLEVVATDEAGASATDDSLTVSAGEMGADWPDFSLTIDSGIADVEPGYTLLTVRPTDPPDGLPLGMIFFVDPAGRPVWRHSVAERIRDIKRRDNGHVVVLTDDAVTEVDMANRVVSTIQRSALPTDTFHHEILLLPGGNLATLSTQLKTIEGYPPETEGGTSQNVVADVIVEFQPDGTVVREFSLFDLLDPMRIVEGFFGGFWNNAYPDDAPTRDWTHGNAMYHDASDDSFVVCLRHQDWLIKVDRVSGALVWTLGAEGDFALTGEGSWFYHPHSPIKTSLGTILMYDNGIGRPGGDAPVSRVVEYAIDASGPDTSEWTATQVWEFTDDSPFFSPIFGDADLQPGGTVLITDGARTDPADQKHFSRVVEVTHEPSPTKLWELKVSDPSYGYRMYRAIRVPTL